MKNCKNRYYIYVIMLVCLMGCIRDGDSNSSPDVLQVRAQFSHEELATRGNVREPIYKDTLWLSDSVYVDAVVSDFVASMDSVQAKGVPIQTADEITSMKMYTFNKEYNTNQAPFKVSEITAKNGDYVFKETIPWPDSDLNKYTFFSIFPNPTVEINAGLSLDVAVNKRNLKYTVPTDVAKQPDLCVSDYKNNLNIVNTPGSNKHRQTFVMKHMLTAIGFEAVGFDLKLSSVTIDKVADQATLNIETLKWSTLTGDKSFSPILKDNNWLMDANRNQWKSTIKPEGYLMMIPQELGEKTITFKYEERAEQSGLGPGEYTMRLQDIPGTQNWEPGKKITYRLRLRTKPAVQDKEVIIYSHIPGYTSGFPLSVIADPDDELTFTWDAPWLKIHRGAPGYVNPSTNGAASGWRTGINNWKNLYFFSNNEHLSTITSRSAIVTVVGKKSGRTTFKVVQKKEWELKLFKEGDIYINDFKRGTINNANNYWIEGGAPVEVKVTVSANGPGNGPTDKNWLTIGTYQSGEKTYMNFAYTWNIHAGIRRTATVTVRGTYGGITKIKRFTLTQRSSSYWIVLQNDAKTFYMGVARYDLGHYYAREEWRCQRAGQGDRLIYQHEYWYYNRNLSGYYWVSQANFKHDAIYWSSTQASNAWGSVRFRNYTFWGNWWVYDGIWYRKSTEWYRCVTTDINRIY